MCKTNGKTLFSGASEILLPSTVVRLVQINSYSNPAPTIAIPISQMRKLSMRVCVICQKITSLSVRAGIQTQLYLAPSIIAREQEKKNTFNFRKQLVGIHISFSSPFHSSLGRQSKDPELHQFLTSLCWWKRSMQKRFLGYYGKNATGIEDTQT